MKTTSNKILVTPVETSGETKNDLGLTLPGTYELQGFERMKVLHVGSDIKDLQEGNEILIYGGAGTKVTEEGKEYRVLSVTDIVIVYE